MMLRQGLRKFSYQFLLSSVFFLALVPGVHAEDARAPLARAIQNIVPSGTVVVYDPAVNIEAMVVAPEGKGEWLAQVQQIADQAHLSVKQEDSILHISNSDQDGATAASPDVVTTPVALSSAGDEEEKWVDQGKTLPQDTAPLSVVDVPETATTQKATEQKVAMAQEAITESVGASANSAVTSGTIPASPMLTESSTPGDTSHAKGVVLASSKNLPQQPEPSAVTATTPDSAPAVSVDSAGGVAINGQPETAPIIASPNASEASPVATGMADTLRQAAQTDIKPTETSPVVQPVASNEAESTPRTTGQSEAVSDSSIMPLTPASEKSALVKKDWVVSPVKKPAKPTVNPGSVSVQAADATVNTPASARLVSGTVMGTPRWTGHQENQGKLRDSSVETLSAAAPVRASVAVPAPAIATPPASPVSLTLDQDASMNVPAPIGVRQDRLTETPLPSKDATPAPKVDKVLSKAVEISAASEKSSTMMTKEVAPAPVAHNVTGNSSLAQGTVMGVPQYDARREARPTNTSAGAALNAGSVGGVSLTSVSSAGSMQAVGMMSLGGAISKLKPAKYHVVYASDVDPSVSVNVPMQGTWQEKLSAIAVAASVRIEDSQGTLTIRRAVEQTNGAPVVAAPTASPVHVSIPSSAPLTNSVRAAPATVAPAAGNPTAPAEGEHETVIQTTETVVEDNVSSDTTSSSSPPPVAPTPEQAAQANAQPVSPPMKEPVGSNFDPNQAERPVAARGLWQAERGSSLRDVLQSWCDRAGVQLVWSSQFDFPLQATVSLDDTFEGAVRTLLGGFSSASPRPVAQLHRQANFGTRVLIVQTRGNRYGE